MHGLNNEEVEINRKKYGTNSITNVKSKGFLKLLLESLGDPIIKILLIALAIKVVFLFQDSNYFETYTSPILTYYILRKKKNFVNCINITYFFFSSFKW